MTGKQSLLRNCSLALRARRWRTAIVGISIMLVVAGCDRPSGVQYTAEMDEPGYRRGQQALRGGKNQEALEAFQKVIDKRQGDAAESHFEVGRLYLDHIKDPVAAIYHLRKYLELQPNGLQAPQVNQMIDTARKEFARQLPGNPMGAQYDQLDLQDQIEKLKAENATLRAELDRVAHSSRQVVASNPPTSGNSRNSPSNPGAAPRGGQTAAPSSAWTNAIPETSPAPNVVPIAPETPPGNAAVRSPPTAPAPSGRTYVVQQGDTLVKISRSQYGTASKWKAIYEANRDRIPDPNGLKIGTELRLP